MSMNFINADIARQLREEIIQKDIYNTIHDILNDIETAVKYGKKRLSISEYAYKNFKYRSDRKLFIRQAKQVLRELGFTVNKFWVIGGPESTYMGEGGWEWFNWEVRW